MFATVSYAIKLTHPSATSLLTIMSGERPSKILKTAGSYKGELSSLYMSRAPTPSSIDVGSDNPTR